MPKRMQDEEESWTEKSERVKVGGIVGETTGSAQNERELGFRGENTKV